MVTAIFQPKIDKLQNQLSVLQAQIERLSLAQVTADEAVRAVRAAVQRIGEADASEVASLKAVVLDLFGNDGNLEDDGGNKPITPSPSPNGNGNDHSHKPEVVLGRDIVELSSKELPAPQPDELELKGQSSELACLFEDCPKSSLQGQAVEVSCWYPGEIKPLELTHVGDGYQEWSAVDAPQVIAEPVAEESLFKLKTLSANVAYMTRGDDGEITCAYAGFNNKTKAKLWGEWLAVHHSVASGFELRPAKRLTEFKHELKLWSMSFQQIERLAGCDLSKNPPSNYGDAPKRQVARTPRAIEIDDIKVGDFVRLTTVRDQEYVVRGVNADGFFECDRLNTNPVITQALHPGSVELVTKASVAQEELSESVEERTVEIAPTPTIDESDVPRGVTLRPTTDDFLIEFNVFAWAIVRNQGKPEPQQKHLGRLVEGLGTIEAYRPRSGINHNFQSTLDAVKYLLNGAGLGTEDIAAALEMQSGVEQRRLSSQVEPAEVANDVAQNITIEIGDWVEFLEDGNNYEVVATGMDRTNLKLEADGKVKFTPCSAVKLVFKKPAEFVPF